MEGEKKVFSEFAIASLALGILSYFQLFAAEKGIVAIVFGILALRNIGRNVEIKGKGLAVAGIILGIGYIILAGLYIATNPQLLQMIKNMPVK